jgi:hypothetical protein
MADEIRPALTAEEWAKRWHTIQCFDSWDEEEQNRSGVGEIHVEAGHLLLTSHEHSLRANFSAPADRHALAALALHGMPFGFTLFDVQLLEHYAETAVEGRHLASIARRLRALIPPELPPQPPPD